ncbi:MAG: hypothetical protein AB7T38_17675 [Nitrospirales bacterium]
MAYGRFKVLLYGIFSYQSKKIHHGLSAILFLSSLLLITPLSAQEFVPPLVPAIEMHTAGQINWTSGTISSVGFGAPPSSAPSAAIQSLATRAAIAVARRNLLELVEGVRIDSETIVENFMVKSDVIQSHVQGVVKNAFVTAKHVLPDGNVEVILTMNMWGNHSLMSNLTPSPTQFLNLSEDTRHKETYTGLVIDARELGIQPATFPKVLDENQYILYEKKTTFPHLVTQKGMVQYFMPTTRPSALLPQYFLYPATETHANHTVEQRVGPRPLHLKGIQKSGSLETDIIVSAADAKKIRQDPSLMDLLHNANVIIVIDPLVAGVEGHLRPENVVAVSYP